MYYLFPFLRNRIIIHSNLHLKDFMCFFLSPVGLKPHVDRKAVHIYRSTRNTAQLVGRGQSSVAFLEQPIEEGKGDSFILARISSNLWVCFSDSRFFLRCRFNLYKGTSPPMREQITLVKSYCVGNFISLGSYYLPHLSAPACSLLDRNFRWLYSSPPVVMGSEKS